MKNLTYFFTALIVVLFSSCNEESENSYYEVETKINAVIPVSSFTPGDLKSESGQLNKEIPFSGSTEYELRELVNNSNQFMNIHRITHTDGSVLSIPDVKDEYEISSLELSWGYKSQIEEDYKMMESIDLISLDYDVANGVLQFDLDEIAEQIVTEINNSGMMLRFSITGECNYNFNGLATLQIPVIIESEVQTPRFELF